MEIETDKVTGVYNQIAKHFNDTRVHQWPWITRFINETNMDGKMILDVGCGNGRNMDGYNKNQVFGIDSCVEFVRISREKGNNVIVGDMCAIPFPDNMFDHILSIASFHHLATRERRIKALVEMARVVKSGGSMLLSVWSIRQPPSTKRNFKRFGDTMVPWNKFGTTYERYYYIFEIKEIVDLFTITGWVIEDHVWDYGNEVFRVRCL